MKSEKEVDNSKLSYKLELMDWKMMEKNARAAIEDSRRSIVIAEILLSNAETKIKSLGGQTDGEIDELARLNKSG